MEVAEEKDKLVQFALGMLDELSLEIRGEPMITAEARVEFWGLRATYYPSGEALYQAALQLLLSLFTKNYGEADSLASIIVWRASPNYEALDDIIHRDRHRRQNKESAT